MLITTKGTHMTSVHNAIHIPTNLGMSGELFGS